ncbi:uncharacterized protein [Procambarus clarkii]|uniref:uncharacterized protein isoform X2 n=1 Tax=Procambarus clarkii TaxID=6728 RepID=UPI0037421820
MGKKVILTVIGLSFLLKFTTSEGRCEPPHRGQHLHYNVRSVPDFRLWLKVEEKNTRVNASFVLNSVETLVSNSIVWSNTDVYTGFPNKLNKQVLGIGDKDIVREVIITANTSMEWIFCPNAFTFPVMPASDNKVMTVVVVVVVVLVVVLLVVVVMLAAAGAYIHRLRKTHNKSTKPVVNKEQVAVLVVLVLLLVGELVVVVVITLV